MTIEQRLIKVGFSPRGVQTLQAGLADPDTVDWTSALRRGDLSPRQVRTLRAGGLSMKTLLRGGFTRHQAKLILEVLAP